MTGMLQVYTGNGKGKTTAAIGLAIRSLGAGHKVFLGQFVKGMVYSEIKALECFQDLTVRQYGQGCFIRDEPTQEDIQKAQEGLREMEEILVAGEHQLVIMDEANIAIYYNLFSIDDLLQVIKRRAKGVEVVVTGRMAHQKLMDEAHLVTNMEEVKHYYQNGVKARVGIER